MRLFEGELAEIGGYSFDFIRKVEESRFSIGDGEAITFSGKVFSFHSLKLGLLGEKFGVVVSDSGEDGCVHILLLVRVVKL